MFESLSDNEDCEYLSWERKFLMALGKWELTTCPDKCKKESKSLVCISNPAQSIFQKELILLSAGPVAQEELDIEDNNFQTYLLCLASHLARLVPLLKVKIKTLFLNFRGEKYCETDGLK